MADVSISVEVEKVLAHDLLKEVARRIYKQNGLVIKEVRFDWVEVGNLVDDGKHVLVGSEILSWAAPTVEPDEKPR